MKNVLHSSELLRVQNDYTCTQSYLLVTGWGIFHACTNANRIVCAYSIGTQSHTHLAHGHLHLASCGEEAVLLHPRHADAEVGPHETQHGEVDTQRAQQVRVAVEHITVGDGPGERGERRGRGSRGGAEREREKK